MSIHLYKAIVQQGVRKVLDHLDMFVTIIWYNEQARK